MFSGFLSPGIGTTDIKKHRRKIGTKKYLRSGVTETFVIPIGTGGNKIVLYLFKTTDTQYISTSENELDSLMKEYINFI